VPTTRSDHPAEALVVSGFGDLALGGGLFEVDGGAVRTIDQLSTTGLHVTAGRVLRLLWSRDPHADAELIVSDERGVRAFLRLDGAWDPHDVRWIDGQVVIAATGPNVVQWWGLDGVLRRTWSPGGEEDSWHLNSLEVVEGALHVCAFGRLARFREWDRSGASGVVVRLDGDGVPSGDVLAGLERPHHPRRDGGRWYVCNSHDHEVLELDLDGRVVRRFPVGGWTRGLVVDADTLTVGVSGGRDRTTAPGSELVTVDRATGAVRERLAIPCDEIYDIVRVPPDLLAGLRGGFASNPTRVRELAQRSMMASVGVGPPRLWMIGVELAVADCRVEVAPVDDVPARWPAGTTRALALQVTNRGGAVMISAAPYPVHASSRWVFAADGAPVGARPDRTPLPGALGPHETVTLTCHVTAPDTPGRYRLVLTLVQEEIRWFHDVDPTNGSWHDVEVDGALDRRD
jgi:acetolactate synthase I/II/III large subunit